MISRRSPLANCVLGFITGIAVTLLSLDLYFYNATPLTTSLIMAMELGHDSRVDHTEPEDAELRVEMQKNVRILCWIMTTPYNTDKKAIHVNATWAPRCNQYIFFSANESSGLPSVKLNISDGRNYLWWKTKEAFKYLYENELDNYDYFLKADDDTYVIVENLRLMLMPYSPKDPLYFGCRFKPFTKQGYMSGGAGYILSREALKRFVEDGLSDPKKCKAGNTGNEDSEMGKCMYKIGVKAVDTRDSRGRHRMLPFSPNTHVPSKGAPPKWFHQYMYYPYDQGDGCCSNYMVSFHYVGPNQMQALDYIIYRLRLFGSYHEHFQNYGIKGASIFTRAKNFAMSYSHLSDPDDPKPASA
ncbi:hypothetical protein L596_011843 [Steinernema carpocapsae]|uniref:Glycoprotein-N-acetylgalactosamine 3-beta-galactosyltransferase 1 n=1 Tax=Steinernema carpocapsae TaxID=34508 RepID=A0A4U5NVI3_STECR|nr:hypothetical protein L596_011843 [Steinernema carpocapsae]